jgi:hypothetical protein
MPGKAPLGGNGSWFPVRDGGTGGSVCEIGREWLNSRGGERDSLLCRLRDCLRRSRWSGEYDRERDRLLFRGLWLRDIDRLLLLL